MKPLFRASPVYALGAEIAAFFRGKIQADGPVMIETTWLFSALTTCKRRPTRSNSRRVAARFIVHPKVETPSR